MHVIDKLSVRSSGIHGVTLALARWMKLHNPAEFTFTVVVLRSYEPSARVLEAAGGRICFLSRKKFDPRTLFDILRLINKHEPQILHLHGYASSDFGRIASRMTGVPNIVHEHVAFDTQPFYQTIADFVLSPFTDKAIAVSDQVARFMIDARKVMPSVLETIVVGVPVDEFELPPKKLIESEKEKLGISRHEKVVCNIGRLDHQKGLLYLFEAFEQTVKECPDTRLLIVGDGPCREMLESLADRLRIRRNIIFTGYMKDVRFLLALSDVVAIPSLFEGGPLTLFEAMSMGKPVIGTPVGSMGEVIKHGVTGFIVPVRNVEELTKHMLILLQNKDRRERMGMAARKRIIEYDTSKSVVRLSSIYRKMS